MSKQLLDKPCAFVIPLFSENFALHELREPVLSGMTRPETWRRLQLKRFRDLIEKNEHNFLEALSNDLRKPPTEALFEVIALKQELKLTEQQLSRWMHPKRIKVPLSLKPGEAFVTPEPLGCVLIIGPWNYPISLTLQPLISALAAGNTAILKPSEHAPASSALIAKLIPKYFPADVVRVFEGDGNLAASLLEEHFDHIFFTGGSNIGRKVMEAAAKNLTPITLELGGKSPAIVLEGADLEITARRIIWGKGINSGQTCIAPNHLLVQKTLKRDLLEKMKTTLVEFYGQEPTKSKHISKIINQHHFLRLQALLNNACQKGQIVFGGEIDTEKSIISPALVDISNPKDPLLEEELFGPILPIFSIPNLEFALDAIRKQPKPLALYMFGGSPSDQQRLLETTSAGGVCFNDVILQAGIPEMPFGGVGASGMGRYHGQAGFRTFSNEKSIMQRNFWLDLKLRYPPYKTNLELLNRLLS